MASLDYVISKTSFLKFEQCAKAFFLYKNFPYLRDKLSTDKQLTFKRGHHVGDLAQNLFPEGIDVAKETSSIKEALVKTQELLEKKQTVIYEAAFSFNGVLIMVDILVFENERFYAYEVKSSLRVSESYLKDAYLQYYVLKNSLRGFEDLFLVTMDGNYVLEKELDVKKLFRKRSVKEKAEENIGYFTHQLAQAFELLDKNIVPDKAIGTQCFRPYTCDFFGHCWKGKTGEDSVFNLPFIDKLKLFEWYDAGIRNIAQIKDSMIAKPAFKIMKNAIQKNEIYIDKQTIQQFIWGLKYPLTTMDMEVWNAAVPVLPGTRPFEQVPFLVCFFNGKTHDHFFFEHQSDEREKLAELLILQSEDYPTVLVYDKTLEVNMINQLITLFPRLEKELNVLKEKLKDVFDVFLNLNYYHPAFKNNLSLKAITSVLLSDVNYSAINSGLEAMNIYEQYRACNNPIERENLKQDLIDYCNVDCLATYKLVDFLSKTLN